MIFKTLLRTPELGLLLVFIVLTLGLFTLTNPRDVQPLVLMAVFGLIFGISYCGLRFGMKVSGLHERLPRTQYLGVLFGGAALPVALLALQSLGQLTVRDVITLVIIYAIGYFYISRMSSRE